MTDRLAQVRARHADIPQDTLPLEVMDFGVRNASTKDERREKSVGQAICPWHTGNGDDATTGLIRSGRRLVFREHGYRVGKTTLRCPGSGLAVPEVQEEL